LNEFTEDMKKVIKIWKRVCNTAV